MHAKLKSLYANDFNRHNLVFLTGSIIIAALNYLYYPVLSRIVSVAEFGEIQALISLFMQLGIILTAFGYVVTNIVANSKNDRTSNTVLLELEKVTLIGALLLFVLTATSSVQLQDSFQFSSPFALMLVGALVLLNVPSTSRTYFLQGKRRMRQVSLAGVIFAFSKLVLSVTLIYLGLSAIGVLLAYILAQTLTLVYLRIKTNDTYPGLAKSLAIQRLGSSDKLRLRTEILFGLAILAALSGLGLLYTSDTVVVRFFFSSFEAGLYSGISAIARIIFFATASFAGVLIASVKIRSAYGANLKLLFKSMKVVTVIGGLLALTFSLFPELVTRLLIGGEYVSASALMVPLAATMMLCSYNNLMVSFLVSLRNYKVLNGIAAGVTVFGLMVALWHESLLQVAIAYLCANLVVFFILVVQILKGADRA